jgi:hypothetical protein
MSYPCVSPSSILSMIGQLDLTPRLIETLQHSFRRLFKVALHPVALSLALLLGLYSLADYAFTLYCFSEIGWVWKPAFPFSWRLALLSLFVVPAFSFLHLLWFAVHYLLHTRSRRYRRHGARSRLRRRYISLPQSGSNTIEDGEFSAMNIFSAVPLSETITER